MFMCDCKREACWKYEKHAAYLNLCPHVHSLYLMCQYLQVCPFAHLKGEMYTHAIVNFYFVEDSYVAS